MASIENVTTRINMKRYRKRQEDEQLRNKQRAEWLKSKKAKQDEQDRKRDQK